MLAEVMTKRGARGLYWPSVLVSLGVKTELCEIILGVYSASVDFGGSLARPRHPPLIPVYAREAFCRRVAFFFSS